MEEDNRFQELDDDVLKEWDDLEEIKESKDCSFGKIYAPIRALFAGDSVILEKFGNCKDHKERVKFLLGMEVVRNCLSEITSSSTAQPEESIPSSTIEAKQTQKMPPKLSYGSSKKYPHLSKAVEVKSSKAEGGRYMVAKQKILPGDVLVVEPAFSTSLFRQYYSSHCFSCFSRLEEPVKCPGCSTVQFCSPPCLNNGWKIHKWECSLLDYVDSQDIGHMATLAYRLISAQNFNYLVDNIDAFETLEASYKEGDYISAFKQESNMFVRPTGDHLKRGVTALILAR